MRRKVRGGRDTVLKKAVYVACAGLIAVGAWNIAILWFGVRLGPIVVLILAPLVWLGAKLTGRMAGRLRAREYLLAGLMGLAALALPPFHMEGAPPGGMAQVLWLTLYLLPAVLLALALLVAATLLIVAHAQYQQRHAAQMREAGWTAGAALALSALLIGKTLHNLYWNTIWDATFDPFPEFWVMAPLLAALAAGGLLAAILGGWLRLTGLAFVLLVPAAILAVSVRTQQVSFRQLTAERAARLSQAIEAYQAREGRYPRTLVELRPWYVLSLSEPVIIYGQDWCYQGGDDYYQLGYVSRAHWSSPILIGEVYAAEGTAPGGAPAVCAEAISALQERTPGAFATQ